MPNRIIKESICTSEDLDKVSPQAEVLFFRLMVKADDFGAYYGNPKIINGACFPLKSYSDKSVRGWLTELVNAGLVIHYTAADGRDYVQFATWEKHQQIRAKRRKFPPCDDSCDHLISGDSKCPRNPIQSNPIQSESNPSIADKPQHTKFTPPTLEEVRAYCEERGNGIDPQRFIDHYASVGWKVGRNAMKDWRACVRTWERRDSDGKPVHGNAQGNSNSGKSWNVHYSVE